MMKTKNILLSLICLLCQVSLFAFNPETDKLLTGAVIARSNASDAVKAFDDNTTTYYEATSPAMQWVGLDLGTAHVITRIQYVPRMGSQGRERMMLGVFEGSNREDFMDAVPLHFIGETPQDGTNTVDVVVTRGFRYVRYIGPSNSYANVAELRFFGHEGAGDDSRFYQITRLPTVSIHVVDNIIPTQKKVDIESLVTFVYDDGTRILEAPVVTRVRGNFSATHENKPYRIKFTDKSRRVLAGSKDESPAKAKKWLLINNFGDKTLMRNPIAFEVSRRVGMPFTPYCKVVDVLLNGEYRGCYQLTDHVSLDRNRINITEMTETDVDEETITGGYSLEMNGYASGDPVNFTSAHGNPITIDSPDADVIQEVQKQYIISYFNEMENRVFGPNYTDPEKGYRKMLDLETFLQYFLANEFSGNTDMLWQVFMNKDRGDSLIYTGPVWDNDLALENDFNVYPGNEREDWTYTTRCAGNWGSFVTRVLSDPAATSRLQSLWAELRDDSLFTSTNIGEYVDSLREEVRESARLNFYRWPYLLQQVHCNPKVWGSWEAEVDNVVNYVNGRVAWMDNKLNYLELAQKNGIYQISTPRDLVKFSELVNAGENNADAMLLTDIDMKTYSDRFTPIGTATRSYSGNFYGNGHTITNLKVDGTRYVGLFSYVAAGATISDLHLGEGCRFTGSQFVGSFVGYQRTSTLTIKGCSSAAEVVATTANAGGFVGNARINTTLHIEDSYFKGYVEAPTGASALTGSADGIVNILHTYNIGQVNGSSQGYEMVNASVVPSFTNCYATNSSQVTLVTPEEVESGRLAFMLNEGGNYNLWRQNIDNGRTPDDHPVQLPSHGTVYQQGDQYTNFSSDGKEYRYYMLDIRATQSPGILQLSEIDLLDEGLRELDDMTVYAATPSTIAHEDWDNIYDNDVRTKYCSGFNGRAYFLMDAGEITKIYGYRMYTANDTQSSPGRNPLSWKLYGSNTQTTDPDDAVWEEIDAQNFNTSMGATNYTPYDFLVLQGIEHMSLSQEQLFLNPGDTQQVSIRIKPSLLSDTPLKWTSSDESVATVDQDGLITALSLGECEIRATAVNFGKRHASCKLTVTDQVLGFRYYALQVTANRRGTSGALQFSEFDLLRDSVELDGLSLYGFKGRAFGSETHDKVVDNRTGTKYCGPFEGDTQFFFDAGETFSPQAYRIYTANDATSYADRTPSSWKLYGSNLESSDLTEDCWTLLDEHLEDTVIQNRNLQPFDFPIDYSKIIWTGIESVDAMPFTPWQGDDSYYDLQGRKLGDALPRSSERKIVIRRGKKLLLAPQSPQKGR